MEIKLTDTEFVYQDRYSTKQILDFTDYYSNRGAVPLHKIPGWTITTVPDLLKEIPTVYQSVAVESGREKEIQLIVALMFRQGIIKYRPLKLLALGGISGLLSFFLVKYARVIHSGSKVYYLSADLPDLPFLRVIGKLGSDLDSLHLMTLDTATDILRDNYFDFVLLGGASPIKDPDAVMKQALRVCQCGGTLLLLTQGQPALEQRYTARLDDFEQYEIFGGHRLLAKSIMDESAEILGKSDRRIEQLITALLPTLQTIETASREQICRAIDALGETAKIAVSQFDVNDDIDVKNHILLLREMLLNYLYAEDAEYKKKCVKLACKQACALL